MAELQSKVALITGASSGIGEATAEALAAEGITVAVAARRKDKLDDLVERITQAGGSAMAFVADVTDRTVCAKLVKDVVAKLGRLDILINNAGVMLNGPVNDAPLEEWEQMVQLNVMGLLYMTHVALPVMRKQKAGHVINISSVAGRTTRPGSAVYNLTKWGVCAFTDALRQELAGEKLPIRTTLIEPGAVDTELQSHLRPEVKAEWDKNFGAMTRLQAADIAAGIVYAVNQPAHVSVNEILIRPTEQAG